MNLERRRDTVLVRLSGEMDHYSAGGIRRELDDVLRDVTIRKMILDMRDMTFMDSSGIGVILGRYRILHQRQGKMAVMNMNPQVEKVFNLSGMSKIIETM